MVVRSGFGVWSEDWSWEGEEGIVKAAEISRRVKDMMADESLPKASQNISKAARSAAMSGNGLSELVRKFGGYV